MIKRKLYLFALFYLVAVGFGVWGFAANAWRFFPYKIVHGIYAEVRGFLIGGEGQSKTIIQKLFTHNQEKKNHFEYHSFVVRDKNFIDRGHLLIPRFSREHEQVLVDLYRIRDFQLIHRWIPPISEIIVRGDQEETTGALRLTEAGFRVQHPILLEDGSIVFSHGEGYLSRIDKVSRLLWVNSHHFHHSVEKGVDGNLVVGININPPSVDYSPGRDDGYAIVSLEGKILETHSVTRILHDNGYLGLLMAFSNVNSQDRLHLNDAQPIYEDNNIAKRGDIALSMRHLSTVAVYRPLDNNIVALQFGPWLFQHDINILPDGRFSIFNNYSIKGRTNSGKPLSTVMIWDPVSGTIESPYKEILKQANMHTSGGGRSRILPNGDVFVEETGRNRLLRVSPDRVRWEYVNAPEDKPEASGALHWSRYYLPDEIPLDWLEGTQ